MLRGSAALRRAAALLRHVRGTARPPPLPRAARSSSVSAASAASASTPPAARSAAAPASPSALTASALSPSAASASGRALVTYTTSHQALTQETLQAAVVLVAHPRADVRRAFINRLCDAAVQRSALVYAIAPSGGVSVTTDGVYRLFTHPTLSRRAILSAMLRHGANMLVFGVISTRDDVMQLLDAVYTGYHCVAEVYGESAHDVLSRLEAIGIDTTMLPGNLRIVVPAAD